MLIITKIENEKVLGAHIKCKFRKIYHLRKKTSIFHLYGCLAAAQLQQTHNVSEKQKHAVAIIKLSMYAQNLQQEDNKAFPCPKQNQCSKKITTLSKTNF